VQTFTNIADWLFIVSHDGTLSVATHRSCHLARLLKVLVCQSVHWYRNAERDKRHGAYHTPFAGNSIRHGDIGNDVIENIEIESRDKRNRKIGCFAQH